MKCPVCSVDIRLVAFKSENRHGRYLQEPRGEFDLYQCMECGLIGLPQIKPNAEYYRLYYPDGYHGCGKGSVFTRIWDWVSVQLIQSRIRLIKRYVSLPCKLIDIGCGPGVFLRQLKSSEIVGSGLEPVKEAVDYACQSGLDVKQGNILTDELEPEKYSVVTLWHVFEHIDEPQRALKRMYQILRPGGIVVMTMPNTHSLAYKLGKKYWYHLDSPRHLWLYNERNIARLLVACGFKVERTGYTPFDFPFDLMWSLIPTWRGKFLMLFYPILKLFDRQNMIVIARK